MSDTATLTATSPVVVAKDVDVTYRVYGDRHRSLRRLVSGDDKQRRYRDVEAVKGASLIVRAGESVGLIGPNGSGKSTLLRAIGGLMPVTEGSVFVKSIPVLLGVRAALEANLSARNNVLLGGTALKIPRSELRERTDEILEFAGVEDFAELPLRTFSSGMKARLQFAISTAVAPEIILIDEALAVGDAEFKEKSEERIKELLDAAGTVFFVSHTMEAVREICDRAIWIDHGTILADGPVEQVVDAYEAYNRRKSAKRSASLST